MHHATLLILPVETRPLKPVRTASSLRESGASEHAIRRLVEDWWFNTSTRSALAQGGHANGSRTSLSIRHFSAALILFDATSLGHYS